jgi:hypothetical protein
VREPLPEPTLPLTRCQTCSLLCLQLLGLAPPPAGCRNARGGGDAAGRVDGREGRARCAAAARQGPESAGEGARMRFQEPFTRHRGPCCRCVLTVSRVKGPTPPPAGLHRGPAPGRSTRSDAHGSWKRRWTILRGWRGASCRSAAPLGLRSSGASAKGALSVLYDDCSSGEAPRDRGME